MSHIPGAYGRTRDRIRALFDRLSDDLARLTPSGGSMPSYGGGLSSDAASGRRLKPVRTPVVAGELGRAYRPGFGWQSLVLVLIVAGVLCIALLPPALVDRIVHGPPPLSPAKRVVLLVSAHPSDQNAVSQAVGPRGYTVHSAATAAEASSDMQREADQIGVVVIDGDMADATRISRQVTAICPEARLIVVSGSHDAGEISRRLVEGGVE